MKNRSRKTPKTKDPEGLGITVLEVFTELSGEVERDRLLAKAIEAANQRIQRDEGGTSGISGGQHLIGLANLPFTPHGIDNAIAAKILKAGVQASELDWACGRFGLGKSALAQLIGIDRTTATRLTAYDKPLPLHAAEALLRMLELIAIAFATFESPEAARGWLCQPHPMLEGDSPFEAAKTTYGTKRVKDLLVFIKYGGVV